MKAAIYTRVSTDEQAEHGYSFEEQERKCRDFIDREGWTYVDTFGDAGVSGKLKHRPQLDRLLAGAADLDAVVINSLDRLGRSTKNLLELYDQFERAGVALVFLRERLDTSTPVGRLLRTLLSAIAEFERDLIVERTSSSLAARARKGGHHGGARPYGYEFVDDELRVVAHEAAVVKRIFDLYLSGAGQKGIVRALNDEAVPTAGGNRWHQSGVSKILGHPLYVGRIRHKGDMFDGVHDAIVDLADWNQAEAIRTGSLKRKGGRHADGRHLLVRGSLRCVCGAAMIPRKARPGVERERYVCSGRTVDKTSCRQPSIRRELIDEPFLATLVERNIDFEATVERWQQQADSALADAQQAADQRSVEVARIDRALATTERDYDGGDITGKQYSQRQERLASERQAAQAALEQAQDHVETVAGQGPVRDAEKALLGYLAALKQAVAEGVDQAPDLNALRNVVAQLFQSVQLVRLGTVPLTGPTEGFIDQAGDPTVLDADGERYWLMLRFRWSAINSVTFEPIGQAIPVPPSQTYPDTFL